MAPQRSRNRRTIRLVLVSAGTACLFWFAFVWTKLLSESSHWTTSSVVHEFMASSVARRHRESEDIPLDVSFKRRGEPHAFAQRRKRRAARATRTGPRTATTSSANVLDNHNGTRYIIFRPSLLGQGAGNIVNGLLAVHLFAEEFDRIVCAPTYDIFNLAFVPLDAQTIELCSKLVDDKGVAAIHIINYEQAPDECALQRRLASDETVVYIAANTYPRWRTVPDKYFRQLYTPTPKLQALLPNPMPKTVVHLRHGDRGGDKRRGLDNETFAALGRALPSDTYLVTNQLTWYDFFAQQYSWRHPDWHIVQHSAAKAFVWTERGKVTERDYDSELQNLQMWSDWYAMANADLVWHTHSDFSLSAIHWMNVSSKTIQGIDPRTGALRLEDESWRTDPPMPPLKDRGLDDIKNCKSRELELLKARYGGEVLAR